MALGSYIWSTDGIPVASRLQSLHDYVGDGVVPLAPLESGGRLDGEVILHVWGASCMGRLAGNFGGFRRSDDHIRRNTPDNLAIKLALRPLGVRHRGVERQLQRGDLFLYSPGDTMELIGQDDRFDLPIFCIARGLIDERVTHLWDDHALVMRSGEPLTRLVGGLLMRLFEDPAGLPEPAVIASLGHAAYLLALATGDRRTEAEGRQALMETRRRQAQAIIRRLHADPDFGPEAAAGMMGCSTRHLQRLFAPTGIGFAERLRSERLRRAWAALGGFERQAITDIALDCGFRDLSTFNRSFKAHFGMSPSEARDHMLIRQ